MTAAEFKKKWSRYQGKETSAYQEHFCDLCRLLGQPTPAEADPSGTELFCFQKRVIKDAELFDLHETPDSSEPGERGFADVWKKDCFAWEYKGKKKNLEEAYKQLLRYRESLLNPPLLAVCDFDRYIIKTNFNGTVQEVHEFTNSQIDRPENLRILRALFTEPEFLKPQRTTAQVTKDLAVQIAEIAKSLQSRESVELADAKSRAEVNVAQKKNLRIARFLNRIVFCFFAEDTGLLPKNLFTEIAKAGINDPKLFAETLENLFAVMAKGGTFGKDKIRCFNGHLFEEASVFELTEFPGSVNGPWARYVAKPDKNGIGKVHYPRLEPRNADCASKLKDRTLTKLYNQRPGWLDFAHKKLDAAVAAAYDWPADLTDEQILERLLALNLERASEEAHAAKSPKPKSQRDKSEQEMI
jgi:hypothetical protein